MFSHQGCIICQHTTRHSDVDNLCNDCLSHLPYYQSDKHCDICSQSLKISKANCRSSEHQHRCQSCQKSSPYIIHSHSFFRYEFPINYWLQQYKFHRQYYYAKIFSQLFIPQYKSIATSNDIDAIIPVPSHPIRLVQHGFDHTALLAKQISHELLIPNQILLTRRQNYKPLSSLSANQRKQYIKDSYVCKPLKHQLKKVALLDDIVTSGSTLREAAKTLFNAGIEQVDVWTIARVLKG